MIRGYSISTLAAGSGAFVSIATNIFLARLMGPSAFGIVGLSLAIILFALIIVCLGLNDVGARYIARAMGEKAYAECRAISLIVLITFFISASLLTWLTLEVSNHIGNLMASDGIASGLQHLAPFIPAIAATQWASMVLKGVGWNIRQILYESFFLRFFIICFALFAWFLTFDPYSVLIAHGMAYSLTAGISGLSAAKALLSLPSSGIAWSSVTKRLFSQGFPLILIGTANRFQRRGDALIIGAILGDASVGIYRAAYTIASATRPIQKVVGTFATHHLARSYGMKRAGLLRSHYDIGVRVSLALTLPIAFTTIGLAEDIIQLLYGGKYMAGIIVVQLLTLGQIAFVAAGPLQALFGTFKANWIRMSISLTSAGFTALLQLLLVKSFGLAGVALATSAGFAIVSITLAWFATKRFDEFHGPPKGGLATAAAAASGGFLLSALPLSQGNIIFIATIGSSALFLFQFKSIQHLAFKIKQQEIIDNSI
jgi:O-antigen/teichoic acid export membrane protein